MAFLLALTAWTYLTVNTFIYSIDRFAIDHLSPNLHWLINYKFILLLFFVLASMAKVSGKALLFYPLYFLFFPFIQFIWLTYIVVKRRSWMLFFAFVNAMVSSFSHPKRKFQVFAYLVIVAVVSLTVENEIILGIAIALAVSLATIQVVIAFLEATKPTELIELYLSAARVVRTSGSEKTFSPSPEYAGLPVEQLTEAQLTEYSSRLQISFIFAHFCAILSRELARFQSSSLRLVPPIFSILGLFASNVFLYSLANYALFKIDIEQFVHDKTVLYFDFFYYAFNNILFNSIEEVRAVGDVARFIHIGQTATIFLILAIVVGAYISMRDQAYSDKLKEVSRGLEDLAGEMRENIRVKFGFSSAEEAMSNLEEARLSILRAFLAFTSGSSSIGK